MARTVTDERRCATARLKRRNMKTEIFTNDLTGAAEILKNGGLVAVPTETVYGLAANGLDADAVEKIYEVKGRPAYKPLSLMVPDAGSMEKYCLEIPPQAKTLAARSR